MSKGEFILFFVLAGMIVALAAYSSGQQGYERGLIDGAEQGTYAQGYHEMYDKIDGYVQSVCGYAHRQQKKDGSGIWMDSLTMGGVDFYCKDQRK